MVCAKAGNFYLEKQIGLIFHTLLAAVSRVELNENQADAKQNGYSSFLNHAGSRPMKLRMVLPEQVGFPFNKNLKSYNYGTVGIGFVKN